VFLGFNLLFKPKEAKVRAFGWQKLAKITGPTLAWVSFMLKPTTAANDLPQ
jgi:hypothetical protein